MKPTNRSTGRHSGPKYPQRFIEGFVTNGRFQEWGIVDGEWTTIGESVFIPTGLSDPIDIEFPTAAIAATYPTIGNGPVTSQYPDLAGAGQNGGVSRGYCLCYRTHTGEYVPLMMPTDRTP